MFKHNKGIGPYDGYIDYLMKKDSKNNKKGAVEMTGSTRYKNPIFLYP